MTIPTPEHLDLSVWPMFHQMSTSGIRVDVEKLDDLWHEVNKLAIKAESELACLAGRAVNPESGDQVAALLKERGRVGKATKTGGRMATDEGSLALIDDPCIPLILEHRGHTKLLTTFIEPTLEKAAKNNGRVHPKWKVTRVRTGRVSCEDPNMMAFPAREKIGLKVRECFIADPGKIMFSIDYSQIEPRLVAALSADKRLLSVYREGRDIYEETARGIFDLGKSHVVDKVLHRLPAKVVTLGVFYGMGPALLYQSLIQFGCGTATKPRFDKSDCGNLIRKWFKTYPDVAKYVDYVCRCARRDGGVVYTEGRRPRLLPALYLSGGGWPQSKMREEAERQAFNTKIQGTAQEYMKMGMLAAWKAFEFTPLLQMHDEIVGQIDEDLADLVPLMAEEMEHVDVSGSGINLPTEFTTGPNWASFKG